MRCLSPYLLVQYIRISTYCILYNVVLPWRSNTRILSDHYYLHALFPEHTVLLYSLSIQRILSKITPYQLIKYTPLVLCTSVVALLGGMRGKSKDRSPLISRLFTFLFGFVTGARFPCTLYVLRWWSRDISLANHVALYMKPELLQAPVCTPRLLCSSPYAHKREHTALFHSMRYTSIYNVQRTYVQRTLNICTYIGHYLCMYVLLRT